MPDGGLYYTQRRGTQEPAVPALKYAGMTGTRSGRITVRRTCDGRRRKNPSRPRHLQVRPSISLGSDHSRISRSIGVRKWGEGYLNKSALIRDRRWRELPAQLLLLPHQLGIRSFDRDGKTHLALLLHHVKTCIVP